MFSVIFAIACDFSAPSDVLQLDSGAPDGDADTDMDDTEDADAQQDPLDVDDDGDGYSENDGDCDDTTATIAPGLQDQCDGVDEDCDGQIDEDAADEDAYEPNGYDSAPSNLGSINDDSVQAIQAALHNDDDVDRYRFSFQDDSWDWSFTINIALSSIPDGAAYAMRVEHIEKGEVLYQSSGAGPLSMEIEENLNYEDGGEYEIAIWSEGGADCGRRYLLALELRD
jgi:hypothetical protein